MKKVNLLRTLAFALILGSLPNNLQAQDYRKSKETKRFAQAVNTGENHTLLILDSSWGDFNTADGNILKSKRPAQLTLRTLYD